MQSGAWQCFDQASRCTNLSLASIAHPIPVGCLRILHTVTTSWHVHPQVVDNSSAFRMTEGVPLVIPEVNPDAMSDVQIGKGGAIIANPNCSTIIALMAVTPLHRLAKVKRMVVSTYQAASGAGAAAMEELRQQTADVLEGKPAAPKIFPVQVGQHHPLAIRTHKHGMIQGCIQMQAALSVAQIWAIHMAITSLGCISCVVPGI